MYFHEIEDGDGQMLGHEAMARIREVVPPVDQPIIFNLTGNVLESDRTMYESSGSNGVLPKPTKLESLIACLETNVHALLLSGLCELDATQQKVRRCRPETVDGVSSLGGPLRATVPARDS